MSCVNDAFFYIELKTYLSISDITHSKPIQWLLKKVNPSFLRSFDKVTDDYLCPIMISDPAGNVSLDIIYFVFLLSKE